MTTDVEHFFFPHTPCTSETGNMEMWSDDCAPVTSPRIEATAPVIDSMENADDNGNVGVSCSPTGLIQSFLPDCMVPLVQPYRQCLAKFLMTGDKSELHISESNIHCYLQVAEILKDRKLERLCEDFLQDNKKAWDHNTCSCDSTEYSVDKDNSINNNSPHHYHRPHGNNHRVPHFQIMFLKPTNNDEHNRVLVMDHRRLNEVQKIPEVKKVTRFGEGFATCTAYIKQCPYVFLSGGYGKKEDSLWKYDVVENKWFQCAHLKSHRKKHVMAFANDNIYIIGGKHCSAVEKYDIENNHCTEINTLPVGVHSAAHAVYENKIFLFGGKCFRGHVSTVQCIDTKTNTITRLHDLPFQCSGGQAVVVNDLIYFATHHGHMIKFDPNSGKSELCSQQPYHRKHFALFEKDGSLHLFGGIRWDGRSEDESTMYTYCPMADEWRKSLSFDASLPIHASCTVVYPKDCPVKPFMKLFGYC